MKIFSFSVWLVVGVIFCAERLAAQEVLVTDPVWLDSEEVSTDALPTFKKKPSVAYSDELKKTGQIHYAIIMQVLNDQGERTSQRLNVSNPLVEKALAGGGAKFFPATNSGKRIAAGNSYSVIFNPAVADGPDASPRLECVSLVVVDKARFPEGAKSPLILWGTVNLDEKGVVQNVTLDGVESARFSAAASAEVQNWRFGPARRKGMPVSSEVRVPVLIATPFVPKLPIVSPKVLHSPKAIYPSGMKIAGISGDVVVEFDVETDGSISDAVVIRSSNPAFNDAAISALMRSTMSPATINGEPVKIRTKRKFIFNCYDQIKEK